MIDALIAGRFYGNPTERTAKNGSRFVTAKVRVPTRDGGAQFINVVAFSATAAGALLALHDGDSVALAGELSARAYTDKTGAPQPSLDLLAHQVLTAYDVQRKRQALKEGNSDSQREDAAPAPPAAVDRDFNDVLPR